MNEYSYETNSTLGNVDITINRSVSLVESLISSLSNMNSQIVSLFDEGRTAIEGLNTAVSNSSTGTNNLTTSINDQLAPAIVSLSEQAGKLQEKLSAKDKAKEIGEVAKEALGLVKIFGDAIGSSQTFTKVYTSLSQGVAAYNSAIKIANSLNKAFGLSLNATPIGWIVGGLAAVTTAIGLFANSEQEASVAVSEHTKALIDEKSKVNELTNQLLNTNTSYADRLEIIKKIKDINPDLVKNINAESVEYNKLSGNLKEYNKEKEKELILRRAEDQLQALKEEANDAKTKEKDAELKLAADLGDFWTAVNTDYSANIEDKQAIATTLEDKTKQKELLGLLSNYYSLEDSINGAIAGKIDFSKEAAQQDAIKNRLVNLLGSEDAFYLAKDNGKDLRSSYGSWLKAKSNADTKEGNVDKQADRYKLGYDILYGEQPLKVNTFTQDKANKLIELNHNLTRNPSEENKNALIKFYESLSENTDVVENGPNKTAGLADGGKGQPKTLGRNAPKTTLLSNANENNESSTSITPYSIPGAQTTSGNITAGGTTQRVYNINIPKFQDSVNNYFTNSNDAKRYADDYLNMVNTGLVNIFSSINQS